MIIELKRYLPEKYLNAVNNTYNSISKNGLNSEGKEAMPLGEGCYLHILKRTDYEASIGSGGVNNNLKEIKSKLDEIIKILNTNK